MGRADIRAGRAYVSLYTRNKQFNQGLAKAENRLMSFGRTVTRVGAGLTLFGASTMGLSAALGALFRDPIKEAMDFEETITKFRATFAEAAPESLAWAKEFTRVLRRSKFETLESLAAFQGFFSGLGVGKGDAAGLSQEMHQLAVDFASFNNVTDEEGMRRFISGLSGSGEVLDRFGINIKEAAVNQKLLAKGLPTISQGATELMKVMARKELIAEAMGSQGAVGDAIRTAGNLAGQLKALRAEIMDMSVAIGTSLLPGAKGVVSTLSAWAKVVAEISAANPGLVVGIAKITIGLFVAGAATAAAGISMMAYGFAMRMVGSGTSRLTGSFKSVTSHLKSISKEYGKKSKATMKWRNEMIKSAQKVATGFQKMALKAIKSLGVASAASIRFAKTAFPPVVTASTWMAKHVNQAVRGVLFGMGLLRSASPTLVARYFNQIGLAIRNGLILAARAAVPVTNRLRQAVNGFMFGLGLLNSLQPTRIARFFNKIGLAVRNYLLPIRGVAVATVNGLKQAFRGLGFGLGLFNSMKPTAVSQYFNRIGLAIREPLIRHIANIRQAVQGLGFGLGLFRTMTPTMVSQHFNRIGLAIRRPFVYAASRIPQPIKNAVASIPGHVRTAMSATRSAAVIGANAIKTAWATVGPSLKKALVYHAKLAFTAIKAAARPAGMAIGLSLRAGIRGAGAAGRGGLAAIGGVARGAASATGALASLTSGLGTKASAALSTFLSQVTSVAFAVMMLGPAFMSLLSPVGLVIAGVLAAGFAWVKFSEQGRAALNRVLSYLKPFIDTIKTAFGGITDAFRAGDLELAAKIAMTGLKVIFLEAATDMAALLGGTWGNAIGELATAITDADMPKAMQVATMMMKAIWTNFTASILRGFIDVSRKVLGAWKSTVDALSNYFLKKAASGGVFGKAFKAITGVDVRAVVERNRKLEAEQRRLGIGGGGDDIFSMFDGATGGGGRDWLDESAQKIRESFAAIGKLANMTPEEIEASVNRALDDLESGTLPQFEAAADAAAKALEEGTAGGANKATAKLAELKDELKDLAALAAKKAADAKAASDQEGEGGIDLGGLGASKLGRQTEVTFSSAAALALGGGKAEGPTVRELKAMRQEQKEAAKEERRARIAAEELIKKDEELIHLVESRFKVPVFGT